MTEPETPDMLGRAREIAEKAYVRIHGGYSFTSRQIKDGQADDHTYVQIALAALQSSAAREREIRVGKFILRESVTPGPAKLWIDWDGEGGEFPVADIEKLIEEYYRVEF